MCFMQHFGLMTTWVRAGVSDKTVSPDPDLNISSDLPNGISPFDLPYKNNEELKVIWEQEQGDEMSKDSDELLWVHDKLGHLSFAKIRFMAAVGWLDKDGATATYQNAQVACMARRLGTHGE